MKRFITLYSLCFSVLFLNQSCEKWFDVTANNQIKAEDQFSSVDGFKDALMGVYLGMGDANLYLSNTSFTMVDVLSQQYAPFTSSLAFYYDFQSYRYQNPKAESLIKRVWDKYYFVIANVNSALNQMDKSTFVWYKGEKEIIRGELLALRAFLHFDLMRFFGHANYAQRPELASKLAIPYSTVYSKDYPPQLTYTETFKQMEGDIKQAMELLKYDPIFKNSLITSEIMMNINRDGFYDNRFNRMNYYAAEALLARVYAWQGGDKMKLAADAAEDVIANSPIELFNNNDQLSNDRTIKKEHLFGLKVQDLQTTASMYFEGTNNTNYNGLRLLHAPTEDLYEVDIPEIGASDIRFIQLLNNEQYGYVSLKLKKQSQNDIDANTIPLMKIPEMYYIASEYYSQNNMTKAISLLEKVRVSRRIVQALPATMDLATYNNELLKEYRKEYVAEGQLFFFYKRKGFKQLPNYTSAVDLDDKVYMLPFPASEVEFGNRVQ